jgi:hypothetical protein
MSQETLVSLFVGSIVTAVVTWAFTHIYYRRAGQDLARAAEQLRQETARTRHLVNTLAHALEAGGHIDVVWADNGELKTFVIRGHGNVTLPGPTIQGTVTVTPPATRRRARRQRHSPQ